MKAAKQRKAHLPDFKTKVRLDALRGNRTVNDIADRPLATIRPLERTTPASCFVASLDRNLKGKEILWEDYAGTISMHPVVNDTSGIVYVLPETRATQILFGLHEVGENTVIARQLAAAATLLEPR